MHPVILVLLFVLVILLIVFVFVRFKTSTSRNAQKEDIHKGTMLFYDALEAGRIQQKARDAGEHTRFVIRQIAKTEEQMKTVHNIQDDIAE